MPLGAFKATLLGAAGSGGESGWVVQPYSDTTGSSPTYWMYDMAIASDDSIWCTTLTSFSNNGAIWHINADGTLAADNDQKVIDPTQSGSTDTRGIAVAANGDVITVGGGPINDGVARTGLLTTANTPGTLVQDWDNSLFNPVGANGYVYQTPFRTKGTSGYGCWYYYDGSSKYISEMWRISLSDGSEQSLGNSTDSWKIEGSYADTLYPVSAFACDDSSGDEWMYIQWRSSANLYVGIQGCKVGTTTTFRQGYLSASSTASQTSNGGVCEADANNLYMTWGDHGQGRLYMVKVAKSDMSIQWQREISIGSRTGGPDYIAPPVTDSSGNVYAVFNSRDTQQFSSANNGSVHWAKWDSSGNIQTLDGTTLKTLTTPTASNSAYPMRAEISSDDNWLYICGAFSSGNRPFVAKLPTDGTGTNNSTALTGNFPGDDLYYKNNWTHTESAGTSVASGHGSGGTNSVSTYTGQVEDHVAQANPGIYLDEVS